MKHIIALLIKFAMIAFGQILYVSITVTAIAYIIGDVFILAVSNNIVATIADAGLALFIIYMFNFLWTNREISFYNALIAAVVIGACEWFFHKHVARNVFPNRRET